MLFPANMLPTVHGHRIGLKFDFLQILSGWIRWLNKEEYPALRCITSHRGMWIPLKSGGPSWRKEDLDLADFAIVYGVQSNQFHYVYCHNPCYAWPFAIGIGLAASSDRAGLCVIDLFLFFLYIYFFFRTTDYRPRGAWAELAGYRAF